MSTRKAIDPAAWLKNWQIAQREARLLLRRAMRQPTRKAAPNGGLAKNNNIARICNIDENRNTKV